MPSAFHVAKFATLLVVPVVVNHVFTSAGVCEGTSVIRNANIPATIGLAKLVPFIDPNCGADPPSVQSGLPGA